MLPAVFCVREAGVSAVGAAAFYPAVETTRRKPLLWRSQPRAQYFRQGFSSRIPQVQSLKTRSYGPFWSAAPARS